MQGLHIYKASAGAGKTYTLALNFLGLIFSSGRVEAYREILAMTFTNKAASEMKERIIHFLSVLSDTAHKDHTALKTHTESLIKKKITPKFAEKTLEHMLHNFSDVSILTLDKFIQQIIKSFAKELDFTHQFTIESNTESLFHEVIDQLMEHLNENEHLSKILEEHSIYKAQQGNSYKLEDELLRSAKQLEREASDDAIKDLKKLDLSAFVALIDSYKSRYNHTVDHLQANKRLFAKTLAGVDLSYKDLKAYLVKIYKIADAHKTGNLQTALFTSKQIEAIEALDFYAKSAAEHIKSGVDAIASKLRDLFIDCQDKLIQLIHQKNIIQGLYATAVINEIDKLVSTVKTEQNILFFVDFNRLSSQIIRQEPVPFIFERTGNRYKHLMLDEFQDTSTSQWHNLLPLMLESLSKGGMGLIVGDEKQAIYRWRNGNVEQFMALPEVSLPEDYTEPYNLKPYFNEAHILPSNFRSNKSIVAFNNAFFLQLQAQISDTYKGVYDHVKQEITQDEEGYVTLTHFDRKVTSRNERDFNLSEILKRIKDLQSRHFELKDIAILTRTNGDAGEIAEFLMAKHGLPVISSESLRIDSSPIVLTILNFFQLLIEPTEKVYQLGVIKFYTESKHLDYNVQLETYTKTENRTLHINIDGFLKNLGLNRFSKPGLSLTRFAHHLIAKLKFNYNDIHTQFFLDILAKFDSEQIISINAFLHWWQKNRHKLNVVIPEDSNAIKVMTFHKSKGLEFPVCIVPKISWYESVKGESWVDEESGTMDKMMMRYSKTMELTPHKETFTTEQAKVNLDNSNLLYVAFTRAEKEMHLITGGGVGQVVHNIAEKICDSGKGILTKGSPCLLEKQILSSNEDILDILPASNLQIDFSIEAPENWAVSDIMSERAYGDLFHKLMSDIQTIEDLTRAIKKRIIGTDEIIINQLTKEVTDLLNHPKIKVLFTPETKHYSERDFIDKSGEIIRPDKIIETKTDTYILEFKTGSPDVKHEKQLRQYGDLLQEINEKTVNLYLVYTRPTNIIKIETRV